MDDNRVVAIHQPNFLPWLGYFHKFTRCDTFILLDDVQFPKTGGNWTNRVQILVAGNPKWMTVPVDRSSSGTRSIAMTEIRADERWVGKSLRSIQQEYGNAPFFDQVYPVVDEALSCSASTLAAFNVFGLCSLLQLMGLPTSKFRTASSFDVKTTATERLADLVAAVGGAAYLTGGGAEEYQQDDLLESRRIEVVHQRFDHPVYPQAGSKEFVPGLSIIDALFNVGPVRCRELLEGA